MLGLNFIYNDFDPELHQVIFSIDGGTTYYYLPEDGEIDVPASGTNLLLFVQAPPSGYFDRTVEYTLGVYDDSGIEIGYLVDLVVNSQTATGVNHLNQVIPGYYVNGYPIRGGVLGHRVRFFAQIKLQNAQPAVFRKYNFDFYLPSMGYFEYTLRTDELGHAEFSIPLLDCTGYEKHVVDGYALDPDVNFKFDLGTFNFTTETINGTKNLNGPNLNKFFDLCVVYNEYFEVYNPFTYEPYED